MSGVQWVPRPALRSDGEGEIGHQLFPEGPVPGESDLLAGGIAPIVTPPGQPQEEQAGRSIPTVAGRSNASTSAARPSTWTKRYGPPAR